MEGKLDLFWRAKEGNQRGEFCEPKHLKLIILCVFGKMIAYLLPNLNMAEGKIFEAFGAPDSPRVAHYSEGLYPVVPGVPVTLSGIVGKDIQTGKLAEGGAGPEAKCILGEVERQLGVIRLNLKHVMHVRVMLAGPVGKTGEPSEDFGAMNDVYREVFKDNDPPPTRDTFGGCQLLDNARVEMVATAWKPSSI